MKDKKYIENNKLTREERLRKMIEEMNKRSEDYIYDNQFITKEGIEKIRTLEFPEFEKMDYKSEYVISVDVARIKGDSQLVIMVIKRVHGRRNEIVCIESIVGQSFKQQKDSIKKYLNYFNTSSLVICPHGLCLGIMDQFKGDECVDIVEARPVSKDNSDVIVKLLRDIEEYNLRLLKTEPDLNDVSNVFKETDIMINEFINLFLKKNPDGRIILKKSNSDIDVSRFSCLYNFYWCLVNL